MGMILKNSLPKFKVGFPTMSDKYNVAPAVLTGSTAVNFGDLVKFSATKGYFESASGGASAITDIAGFVIGTNVKLALAYPGTDASVETVPGEAFNLSLPNTYMAIKLKANAVASDIVAGAKVYVTLADGTCTTATNASAGTIVELPGVVFTGEYETVGSNIVAEIYIK